MSSSQLLEANRILVTGGSGFLGTNIVQYLLDRKAEVLSLDKAEPRNAAHRSVWRQVDILDVPTLQRAFSDFRPDLLIHMAARTDLGGRNLEDYIENTEGVRNVVRVANACPSLSRAIYASTRMVFRIDHKPQHDYDYSGVTFYGKSKIEGELIVRNQGPEAIPWVLVRPTSIWGPWFELPYRRFFGSIESGRYVHPRRRRILKTFGYVENLVHELMWIAAAPDDAVVGRVFFLADYEPIEVFEWSKLIARKFGVRNPPEIPFPILKLMALVGDAVQALGVKRPPLTSFGLNNLVTNMVYPMSPTQKVVGELPFSLEDGVARTVEWMNAAR